MSSIVESSLPREPARGVAPAQAPRPASWLRTEDAWAIVLGVGLVLAGVIAVWSGSSIKWLAIAPQKWNAPLELLAQLADGTLRYAALYVFWLLAFGLSTRALGIRSAQFPPAFSLVFVLSLAVMALGAWSQACLLYTSPSPRD